MLAWNDLKNRTISVYGADWCPDCVRFKQLLDTLEITYQDINIDADESAKDYMVQKAGHFSIPQFELEGKWMVRGWHSEAPGKWNEATFFKELGAAMDET